MTTSEKKAQKLWAKFTPEKQGNFWTKYETLHKESIALQQNPPKVNTPTKQAQTLDKQVFSPSRLVFVYFLIIPIVAIGFAIAFSSLWAGGFIFILFTFRFGGALPNFRTFEITQSHLIIKNPYIFSKKRLLLEHIQCLDVSKEGATLLHPHPSNYYFFVTLHDEPIQLYPYKLSYKTHQAFFQELTQRGLPVDSGDYKGYSF